MLTLISLHKIILDDLGVRQIAAVVGGSMGGMLVLEYAFFGRNYVRSIVPIATSSRHSAWGISWGEAQRQSIYADPKYEDGYYSFEDPPNSGLGAARMAALLTYRSRDSFESRFGRNVPDVSQIQKITDSNLPDSSSNEHWAVHNDGHRATRSSGGSPKNHTPLTPQTNGVSTHVNGHANNFTDPQFHGATTFQPDIVPGNKSKPTSTYFSAQSYLRYQGNKFVKRFDCNCYIALSRKLDTHDVSRNRVPQDSPNPIAGALSQIEQPTLVLGIESDGLFTFAEQQEIAAAVPNARLRTIDSPEGHDAFLLQFEQVNRHILDFFREVLPEFMQRSVTKEDDGAGQGHDNVGTMTRTSTFGEAEVGDITAW
jgi:homoserine O-acetyltransferase